MRAFKIKVAEQTLCPAMLREDICLQKKGKLLAPNFHADLLPTKAGSNEECYESFVRYTLSPTESVPVFSTEA
jgi:hypothetical protein